MQDLAAPRIVTVRRVLKDAKADRPLTPSLSLSHITSHLCIDTSPLEIPELPFALGDFGDGLSKINPSVPCREVCVEVTDPI